MKRVVRLLITLYPRSWRERYGVEFAALLEDLPCGLTDIVDVLAGGIRVSLGQRGWTESCAHVMLAVALAWAASQSVVCAAAVRVAEWIFPLLGTPVVREANTLLLPAHQLSGVSLCQGALGFVAFWLVSMFCWLFRDHQFGEQTLLFGALLPSAFLGFSARIIITGMLAEANEPDALIAVVGSASFLLVVAISLSVFLWASSLAARVAVSRRRRSVPQP